ncbi:tRNA (adenosine(37)-N6)-dimethylallyltransferase MiaA [Methylocapsa palsarum]|uniref:tRNA dimethylallyltransferase n=1 Tax=Methylocapsa palsarum TaxID=1612308 RepID=A0A1I3XEK4_9HYPH|nr:tRNA (adenosine(37)-N6)-dimethylallyltransferase MiaA [Methylocapsa palsarum]SFK17511.1 tRNA dimethylallyltransferase [Methylocapsa palsarum]
MKAISAILLAGPTASGKSALALRLACAFNGVLINADSMQVYRDLRLLTARPSEAEEAQAPHALFGHIDGALNYSVGLWLKDAAGALEDARRRGLLPIFVGGTGLYFKALTQGLSDIPQVPEDVRARVRARAQNVPVEVLHAELGRRDPDMAARLRPTDPQRILRALEILETTGKSLASFQIEREPPVLDASGALALFLAPGREILAQRIDARFDAMLQAGALEEARALRRRGLDPALPVMRAHGAPRLIAYLNGELSLAEAAASAKLETRQYAKRQFTFARRQLPLFRWVTEQEAEAQARAALVRALSDRMTSCDRSEIAPESKA